jgi:hypothetical protein
MFDQYNRTGSITCLRQQSCSLEAKTSNSECMLQTAQMERLMLYRPTRPHLKKKISEHEVIGCWWMGKIPAIFSAHRILTTRHVVFL